MDLDIARWQWNEDSLSGIGEIDADHRHFGMLIGDLDCAVAAGAEESIVEEKMRAIAHDALAHFDKEDRLLTLYSYPGRNSHTNVHNDIRSILRPMVQSDRRTLAINVAGKKWVLSPVQLKVLLVGHLVYEDAGFRDFLKGRGNEH